MPEQPLSADTVAVNRADLIAVLDLQARPRAVATLAELEAVDRLRAALGFVWNEVTGRWDATQIDGGRADD